MNLTEATKFLNSHGYSLIKESTENIVYIGTECLGYTGSVASFTAPIIVTTDMQKAINKIAETYNIQAEEVPVFNGDIDPVEGPCILTGNLI